MPLNEVTIPQHRAGLIETADGSWLAPYLERGAHWLGLSWRVWGIAEMPAYALRRPWSGVGNSSGGGVTDVSKRD